MIQSNYIKIFSVTVYHSYYESGKCNCLHFTPNPKTERMLSNFGFKPQIVSNGFDLFSNTTSPLSNLLDYIFTTTGLDYFEFDLVCSNPHFMLFTEMPLNWLGEMNYSSQNTKNKTNKNVITLTETPETKLMTPIFGHLKIYFKDLKNNSDTNVSTIFEIKFTARATQWQYYFINKNKTPLNNLTIEQNGAIEFDGPKQVTLPTGEQALLFTSNTSNIPLSEKPKYKFDLVNKPPVNNAVPNLKGKIVIKGLPVPDVSRLGLVANSDKKQAASPMYIYL